MQDDSGRLIAADLCIFGEMLHIVNVYTPVGGLNARNDEQNRFYDSIYLYVQSVFPTLMAGDFNCVDNPSVDRSIYDIKRTLRYRSDSLIELCNVFDFKDTLRSLNNNSRVCTWFGPTVATRSDRIYATEGIVVKSNDTCHVTVSDHSLVKATLEISCNRTLGKDFGKIMFLYLAARSCIQ